MNTLLVNGIKEYFQNTPKETIKKDWAEIKEYSGKESPNIYEYLDFLEDYYPLGFYCASPPETHKFSKKYDLDYSGSFFCLNLQHG